MKIVGKKFFITLTFLVLLLLLFDAENEINNLEAENLLMNRKILSLKRYDE
jgi:hypothetical protein